MYWVNGLYPIVVNGVNQFQGADPAAGVPYGTQITPAWLTGVQTEILSVIQAAGMQPSETDNTPHESPHFV
ncbi:MAG: hypothetical protein ACYCZB_18325 [Acidiphilium sp.]